MSQQRFVTADRLRIEVQDDWPGLPNTIANPSGEFGAFGWVREQATATLTAVTGPALRLTRVSTSNPVVRNDLVDVRDAPSGGQARGRLTKVGGTATGGIRAQIEFYNAAKQLIDVGGWTGWQTANGALDVPTGTGTINPGVSYIALAIQASASNGQYVDFKDAALVYGDPGDVAVTPIAEPGWIDITGPTITANIKSAGLEVGMLTATVRDSALDPSQTGVIRKGKRCRASALNFDTSEWEPLHTGTLLDADVSYDLLQPNEGKRPKIVLQSVDPVSVLANTPRPDGVGTIEALPYVLAGAGVPWNVNGSAEPVYTAVVVATSEGAQALDQVIMTRDSCAPAWAWVDRRGVLQVQDSAYIDHAFAATMDDDFYTANGFELGYATSDVINSVTVVLRTITLSGGTDETTYGPYEDQTSIRLNGKHDKTFTIQGDPGVWDDTAISTYASMIMLANGYPSLRINQVVAAVTDDADFATDGKVLRDLYDLVDLSNSVADVSGVGRIASIEHQISATRWSVTFTFSEDGFVARPKRVEPLPTPAGTGAGRARLFIGLDNQPKMVTSSGSVQPLTFGEPLTAMHEDPSFEDPLLADHELFWTTGSPVVTVVTDDVLEAQHALLIELDAGEVQIVEESEVDVLPGDIAEFGWFLKALDGDPSVELVLLTATAAPEVLDGDTRYDTDKPRFPGDTYGQLKRTGSVPSGHLKARFACRVSAGAAPATVLVDLGFSRIVGNAIPSLEWGEDALPGDITPSGTTNSTLTGLQVDVDCPGTTAVYRVDLTASVSFTGAQTNIVELMVDGSAWPTILPQGAAAAGVRLTGAMHWMITGLTAGSHSFTARTRNDAVGTAAIVKAAQTKLTVTRISG